MEDFLKIIHAWDGTETSLENSPELRDTLDELVKLRHKISTKT